MTKEGKFTIEDIADIAKAKYPKEMSRDIDGDYHDCNEYKRESFAIGMMTAFKLADKFE